MSSLHHQRENDPLRTAPPVAAVHFLDVPPMLHPSAYAWCIVLAALDIMLTWFILARSGVEVNPVAREVIQAWGLPGAIAFKFALVILAIVICEIVGRQRPGTGWSLAAAAALINAIPVGWAFVLIASNWEHFAAAVPIPH